MMKYAVVAAMKCPGSPAWFHHAQCQVTTSFQEDCGTVYAEMKARIDGESGWVDPHNAGQYVFVSGEPAARLSAERTATHGAHPTSKSPYTDKLEFTLTAQGEGCEVEACSESQVFSVLDMGTNFCNLHDLWAGKKDGVGVARTELTYTEKVGECTDSDQSKCLVPYQPPLLLEVAGPTLRISADTGSLDWTTPWSLELRDAALGNDAYLIASAADESAAKAAAAEIQACTKESCEIQTQPCPTPRMPWVPCMERQALLREGRVLATLNAGATADLVWGLLADAKLDLQLYCVCPVAGASSGEVHFYSCGQAEFDKVAASHSTECGPSAPKASLHV